MYVTQVVAAQQVAVQYFIAAAWPAARTIITTPGLSIPCMGDGVNLNSTSWLTGYNASACPEGFSRSGDELMERTVSTGRFTERYEVLLQWSRR